MDVDPADIRMIRQYLENTVVADILVFQDTLVEEVEAVEEVEVVAVVADKQRVLHTDFVVL